MEVHACLGNCERQMFIILDGNSKTYDQETNPRIDEFVEKRILDEYRNAEFDNLNSSLSVAKTENFLFRKHDDEDEKIVWVEPLLQEEINKVII